MGGQGPAYQESEIYTSYVYMVDSQVGGRPGRLPFHRGAGRPLFSPHEATRVMTRVLRRTGLVLASLFACGCSGAAVADPEVASAPQELAVLEYGYQPTFLGGTTYLRLNRSGAVTYSYSSHPHTGSGGRIVNEDWTLAEDEAQRALAALVAAGLFELGMGGEGAFPAHRFTLTLEGGQERVQPAELPAPVWEVLRPLLAHADPERWQGSGPPGGE